MGVQSDAQGVLDSRCVGGVQVAGGLLLGRRGEKPQEPKPPEKKAPETKTPSSKPEDKKWKLFGFPRRGPVRRSLQRLQNFDDGLKLISRYAFQSSIFYACQFSVDLSGDCFSFLR